MSRRSPKRRSNWRLILALVAAGTLVGLIAQARTGPFWSLSGHVPALSIPGMDE